LTQRFDFFFGRNEKGEREVCQTQPKAFKIIKYQG
jgi:hypothetical protein